MVLIVHLNRYILKALKDFRIDWSFISEKREDVIMLSPLNLRPTYISAVENQDQISKIHNTWPLEISTRLNNPESFIIRRQSNFSNIQ